MLIRNHYGIALTSSSSPIFSINFTLCSFCARHHPIEGSTWCAHHLMWMMENYAISFNTTLYGACGISAIFLNHFNFHISIPSCNNEPHRSFLFFFLQCLLLIFTERAAFMEFLLVIPVFFSIHLHSFVLSIKLHVNKIVMIYKNCFICWGSEWYYSFSCANGKKQNAFQLWEIYIGEKCA